MGDVSILYFRQQQQRAIQAHETCKRTLYFQKFFELFFFERGVVYEPLYACAYYGKRCLQFVRGIAYKLFLLLEIVFGTLHCLLCRMAQFAEFHYR